VGLGHLALKPMWIQVRGLNIKKNPTDMSTGDPWVDSWHALPPTLFGLHPISLAQQELARPFWVTSGVEILLLEAMGFQVFVVGRV